MTRGLLVFVISHAENPKNGAKYCFFLILPLTNQKIAIIIKKSYIRYECNFINHLHYNDSFCTHCVTRFNSSVRGGLRHCGWAIGVSPIVDELL